MKKILILPIILLYFAREANAQEPNWLSLTDQTFGEQIFSATVNSGNILTVGGVFNDTFGQYFSVYDSVTNKFTNTMPAPASVTCQYYWQQTSTWYIGITESPYLLRWNRTLEEWEQFVVLDSTVNCIEAYGEKLAIGGNFSEHILLLASEGGIQHLASGVNTDVFSLKAAGDSLLIGMGYGGSGENALTAWDGVQFVSIGNLVFSTLDRIEFHNNVIDVSALVYFNGSLQNRVMRFVDGEWKELMVTNPWGSEALLWDENSSTLLVGGLFTQVYDQTDTLNVTSPIVGYKDDSIILYPTMYGGAKAITKYNDEIVIVGNFASNVNGPYYPSVYRLTSDTTTTGGTDAVETENLSGVTLFPNPATSYITVSGLPVQKTDLEIYDYLGRRVALYNDVVSMITLDVSNLSNGVYFIKTQKDVAKFIKK